MATKVRTAHAQNRGVARFLKNDRDKTIGGGLELLAICWPVLNLKTFPAIINRARNSEGENPLSQPDLGKCSIVTRPPFYVRVRG